MSLSNLKPWPKGVSGNPSGRPQISEELKRVKSLSHLETLKLISKYARLSHGEIINILEDKKAPMLELVIASIFKEALEKGDFMRLGALLDRAIGKVKDTMPADEEDERMEQLRKLPINELIKLIQNSSPKD